MASQKDAFPYLGLEHGEHSRLLRARVPNPGKLLPPIPYLLRREPDPAEEMVQQKVQD
jgi:hypothetical protein